MDRYTKVILTVIAVALSIIAIQNTGVIPAIAQTNVIPARVAICNVSGSQCASITGNGSGLFGSGLVVAPVQRNSRMDVQ